jgi:hypothetical protein
MCRVASGSFVGWRERASDLRHYVGMGDRYRTADGWAVEVVELSATPDRNDGERLKVTYCGFFVALVRTGRSPGLGLTMTLRPFRTEPNRVRPLQALRIRLYPRDQRRKSMTDQGKHRSNSCDDSSDTDDKRTDFP